MVACAAAACADSGLLVQLTNRNVTDNSGGVLPASASYSVNNDGTVMRQTGAGAPTLIENWLVPGSLASLFEVRATVTFGSVAGASTGAWLSLGTSRTWSNSASSGSQVSGVITVEIRRASDLVVVASASITVNANAT